MFIFCGCFHSSSVGINYLETEIENFQKLARLISNYAASFPDTKYVFVPSSEDLPATPIMPRYEVLGCRPFKGNLLKFINQNLIKHQKIPLH